MCLGVEELLKPLEVYTRISKVFRASMTAEEKRGCIAERRKCDGAEKSG